MQEAGGAAGGSSFDRDHERGEEDRWRPGEGELKERVTLVHGDAGAVVGIN